MKPQLDPFIQPNVYAIKGHVLGGLHQMAVIDGVEYTWGGGFGAVLKSRERGMRSGDIRMILDIPMHVFTVYDAEWFWQKPEVSWTIPTAYISAEWIREFKRVVFSA